MIVAGRLCARCGVNIDHRDVRSRHCSPLCRNRDYEGAVIGTIRDCRACGVQFAPTKGTHIYCSRTCCNRADIARNRADYNRRNAVRRALERGARVEGESFTREEIFDRDGWICQLCFAPIDWTLSGRTPRSPALDHIIPLARGGVHSRDNVWASHFGCNAAKSDRLDVVILPVPRAA